MAGLLGKIEGFDPELEEWPQYVEHLEHFLEVNGIIGEANAAKRRSTFLSVIGPAPYKLLRSLLSPARPTEKSFEELTEVHYSPLPSEVMQRFRFNSRSRNAGESMAAYVADLRRLAEFCNFGTALNKMIRDRLVVGVNCESIQKRLLAEKDLTYKRALAIAQGSEEADRNLWEMRAPKRQVCRPWRERCGEAGTNTSDSVGWLPTKEKYSWEEQRNPSWSVLLLWWAWT